MFLPGVVHLDLDLDMFSCLASIFPEVLITLISAKLRYSQSRISTAQNYNFWVWIGSVSGSGLGPKLKTVIAQLRLSRSIF